MDFPFESYLASLTMHAILPFRFPHSFYILSQLSSHNRYKTALCDHLSREKQHNQTEMDTLSDHMKLIEKLQVFKIQGRDKHGRKVLRIIGQYFPARSVSREAVNEYLKEKIFPTLEEKPFSIVYVHTDVNRSENFPGISTLRSIYESIPVSLKDNLEAVHFVHPSLQARLFLATFGRLIFTGGLYNKVNYVTRLEFLWEHVKRNEMEIPEFVYDHDEELEFRPMMDYGIESDHPRVYGEPPAMDSSVSMYSMRCIA